MSTNIDIFVEQNETSGLFDIEFEDGDIKSINSFDTAIFMSFYGERRADESEQPVNYLRRGWWGNELSTVEGFEQGSKIWELYQQRATQEIANRAQSFTQEAFNWLVEDGHLDEIVVETTKTSDNIEIQATFFRSQNQVDSKSFKLWENTG
jgi:phage gp46-like protein